LEFSASVGFIHKEVRLLIPTKCRSLDHQNRFSFKFLLLSYAMFLNVNQILGSHCVISITVHSIKRSVYKFSQP